MSRGQREKSRPIPWWVDELARAGIALPGQDKLDLLVDKHQFMSAPTESRQLRLALPTVLWYELAPEVVLAEMVQAGMSVNKVPEELRARLRLPTARRNVALATVLAEVAFILHRATLGRTIPPLRYDRNLDAAAEYRDTRRIRVSLPKPVWEVLERLAKLVGRPLDAFISRLVSASALVGEIVGYRQRYGTEEWQFENKDWLEMGSTDYVGYEDLVEFGGNLAVTSATDEGEP